MIPEQKIVQGSNKGKKEIRRVKKRTSLLSLSLSLKMIKTYCDVDYKHKIFRPHPCEGAAAAAYGPDHVNGK
jgi:hypothetical protein